MQLHRIRSALAGGALGLVLLAPATVPAQEAPKAPAPKEGRAFESREALNQDYDRQFAELDRRRILDLLALAEKLAGAEAEAACRDAFTLAITRDLYDTAEPGADAYLASTRGDARNRALAEFVKLIAQSNRGDYDQAIRGLEQFLRSQPAEAGAAIDPNTVLALGEAFLQRLIRAGRYDAARKVGALLAGSDDPAVKQHFAARLARLEMLGKPAPPIQASDLDGRKVSLADLRGKVVLVDFWATWCPPCVAEMPRINSVAEQYGDRGLEVMGVNLDAAQEGADPRRVQTAVREFLVDNRVSWPNITGPAAADIAQAYGVTEIPANFLIDRDGTIIHVELGGPERDKAIAQAVGGDDKTGTASEKPRRK